jgi:hypothetical protein
MFCFQCRRRKNLPEYPRKTQIVNERLIVYQSGSVEHANDGRLLRVEQRFADVEGGGGSGGDCAGQRAAHHVRLGVVAATGVGVLLHELVGHEVDALEGHVHRQLGRVRAVEGAQPLRLVHPAHTLGARLVRTPVHLQPLLHHCNTRTFGVKDTYLYKYFGKKKGNQINGDENLSRSKNVLINKHHLFATKIVPR